jgi:hypothetical protein
MIGHKRHQPEESIVRTLDAIDGMNWHKRNQLEEAIVRTLGVSNGQAEELKLKIKRLLLTDRRLGRGKRSQRSGDHYAFYSAQPQGSGVEVMFNGYEVFALMAALFLLGLGIPQAKAVSILREVRQDLEAAHAEILKEDPKVLFDHEAIRAMASPGVILDSTAPIFLSVVRRSTGKGRVGATISVCRGLDEFGKFIREHAVVGSTGSHFQLPGLMHALARNLSQTRPVKRGRSTV